MENNTLFDVHPWNRELWSWLSSGQDSGTHAWLFHGTAGLGRHAVALALAERMLARDARTRNLLSAGSHPDLHVLMPEVRESGDLLSAYAQRYFKIDAKPDAKPKTVITVAQVRLLVERIATRAHSGENKVVIMAFADRMNINAANALLKVLEEPPYGTLFVLITDRAGRLPATVRSRASRVPFRAPAKALASEWLQSQLQNGKDAALLLQMANGAPLQALEFARSNANETRLRVATDLAALWRGRGSPLSLAASWHELGLRAVLPWLQKLLCDLARSAGGVAPGSHLFNPDQSEWIQEAQKQLNLTRAYALYQYLGRILADLDSPLDQRLLLEDVAIELARLPAR